MELEPAWRSSATIVTNPRRRRFGFARRFFERRDAQASRLLHDGTQVAVEKHKRGGDYLKSIVYGGMDGIVSVAFFPRPRR